MRGALLGPLDSTGSIACHIELFPGYALVVPHGLHSCGDSLQGEASGPSILSDKAMFPSIGDQRVSDSKERLSYLGATYRFSGGDTTFFAQFSCGYSWCRAPGVGVLGHPLASYLCRPVLPVGITVTVGRVP